MTLDNTSVPISRICESDLTWNGLTRWNSLAWCERPEQVAALWYEQRQTLLRQHADRPGFYHQTGRVFDATNGQVIESIDVTFEISPPPPPESDPIADDDAVSWESRMDYWVLTGCVTVATAVVIVPVAAVVGSAWLVSAGVEQVRSMVGKFCKASAQ